MKFIDLFAGVGGFRLGMEKAGHKCVWSCEIDKWCKSVYRYRFGKVESGDAREVDAEGIPDFDILCAGFPCQSFSIAGKRKGFQDIRGTLFNEISRIARAKRPCLLLLENVKGLLSNDRGQTFLAILQDLGSIGYWCEWQVLNSKNFGVPQNRERVFIVGHLGEESSREIFPLIGGKDRLDEMGRETETRRKPFMIHNIYGGFGEKKPRVFDKYSPTIRTPKGGGHLPLVVDDNVRRLTPVECERFQGFPDGWTELGLDEKGKKIAISDTQRYRMMGNAVTVPVIECLADRLREVDSDAGQMSASGL